MGIKELKGNIFTTKSQTIVNTINCVGVMGAGIALEFRLREPLMYRRYVELCKNKQINPGVLWIFRSSERVVLNFPTKKDWKRPSKLEYLEMGLKKFVQNYRNKNITSIAFPVLGADKGGIDVCTSKRIMHDYLSDLADLDVEIYEYDPHSPDELYGNLLQIFMSRSLIDIAEEIGVPVHRLEVISEVVKSGSICQLGQLRQISGVGLSTLEKIFILSKSADQKSCQYRLL